MLGVAADLLGNMNDMKAANGNGTLVLQTERASQRDYWLQHSEPTVEAMMLDSKAAIIDKLERPEVEPFARCPQPPKLFLRHRLPAGFLVAVPEQCNAFGIHSMS